MKGYSFDIVTGTLTVTADFAKAAAMQNTAAYRIVRYLRHDFPELKIERRTHATPRKYRTGNEEIYHCNPHKHLTYKNMEAFMANIPNGDKFLATYDRLRALTKVQTNGYAAVRRWFQAQFPEYRRNPLIYIENSVPVITALEPFLNNPDIQNVS